MNVQRMKALIQRIRDDATTCRDELQEDHSDCINTGDYVAYITKDSIGYQLVTAIVIRLHDNKKQADLQTVDSILDATKGVHIQIPYHALTKLKIVWQQNKMPLVDGEN